MSPTVPPRQEGVHRRFVEGVAGKLLTMALQFGEQFLLVPLFLFFWGQAYGDWLALLSVAGAIAVIDLGLQGYYGNALQMAWARGERDTFARLLRQGIAIYATLVLVALPCVIVTALAAPWPALLNLAESGGSASTIILLLGLSTLAAVPFGMVIGLYRARGEFAFGVLASLLLRLALVLATAAALAAGATPPGLAAIHLCITMAGWGIVLAHQRRRYPDLRFGFERPGPAEARTLLRVAPFYALIPAAQAMTVHGTVVALAAMGGGSAVVVVFATLRTLTSLARSVTEQITHVAGVEFARQYAQDDRAALQRLYRFAGRLSGAMAGALAGLIAIIGPYFLELWTLGRVPFAPPVFWPLLAAAALSGPALAGNALLYFVSQPRGLAAALLACGAVTLALAIALAPWFGAAGVAIGVLVAEIMAGLIVPTLAAKVAGLSSWRCIAIGQLCAAAAFAVSAAVAKTALALVGAADLPHLVAVGGLWLAIAPWPLALVLFDAGQRRWIRDRIAGRLQRV